MQLIHIEPQTSGEAGGITSSLRCEIAAWRKPEEDKPSFALETCCLLSAVFSATRLLGPLPPEETTLSRYSSAYTRCFGNIQSLSRYMLVILILLRLHIFWNN